MRFSRSIRFRVALWYLAVLTAILLLFSAGIYVTLRQTLSDNLNDSLRTRAAVVESSVEYDAADTPSLDLPTNNNDPNLGDSFERVFDSQGKPVFDNSQVFGAAPPQPGAINRVIAGGEQIRTQGDGETEARVLARPLVRNGKTVGAVQVGQATADLNDTLTNLLIIVAIGVSGALVLASFGGWWLASRALSPIDHVTRLAREITGHDLSQRLNLDLPDDEVGRLARTFDSMIARLDEMFERQRSFTADASHELRTPITAMRGQIDVALQRPREPAEYERVLRTVNEQIDRMTRLVAGLLILARSDARAFPLHRESVTIRNLIESAAEQIEPAAAAKGIGVIVIPGPDATVSGDADLLLQLVLNIGDNAVKYTASGSITLGWEVDASSVTLFVADTGPGVPAKHQSLIFERFHRVDAERASEGAGLGLAICKWIAEAHHGQIKLISSPAGSRFAFVLPRN